MEEKRKPHPRRKEHPKEITYHTDVPGGKFRDRIFRKTGLIVPFDVSFGSL